MSDTHKQGEFDRVWIERVAIRYATSMEDTGPALQQCLGEIDRLERELAEKRKECERLRSQLANAEHEAEQITKRYAAYVSPEVHQEVVMERDEAQRRFEAVDVTAFINEAVRLALNPTGLGIRLSESQEESPVASPGPTNTTEAPK